MYLDRENFAWACILVIMPCAKSGGRQMAEDYQWKILIGKILMN